MIYMRFFRQLERNSILKTPRPQWRQCYGAYGQLYEVSALGMVRRRGEKISIELKEGNPYVTIYLREFQQAVPVAWLVAGAFYGKRPKGYHIDHVNNVKDDNRASNLEYVTPAENHRRAMAFRAPKPRQLSLGEFLNVWTLAHDRVRSESKESLTKNITLGFRLTPEEYEQMQAKTEKSGVGFSDWARSVLRSQLPK